MNDYIFVTDHAKERAMKRFFMKPKKLKEFANKAVTVGFSIQDAPSKEIRNYLKERKRKDRKIYVYSGYVFIFSVGKKMYLITAYRIPKYYLSTIEDDNI